MGKKKKTPQAPWLVFLEGLGLSLAVYLLGLLLAALLVIRGMLPEERLFAAVAASCLLSSFVGGMLCAKRSPWGPLPGALLLAVLFTAVLAAVGVLCWGAAWTGTSAVLLLCALAGGVLAGLLRVRRRQRGRRKLRVL